MRHFLSLSALSRRRSRKMSLSRLRDNQSKQEQMSKLPMTAAGHSAIEDELKQRIRIERPHLVERIQAAIADDSNLAENSEYQAAKTEQEINEARIAELEDKLARAEVIDVSKLSGDTITFGATVTLMDEDTGEKKVWQIVGEPEADVKQGKISVTSPIARALIGEVTEIFPCFTSASGSPTICQTFFSPVSSSISVTVAPNVMVSPESFDTSITSARASLSSSSAMRASLISCSVFAA